MSNLIQDVSTFGQMYPFPIDTTKISSFGYLQGEGTTFNEAIPLLIEQYKKDYING